MKNILLSIFAICAVGMHVKAQSFTTDVSFHTQFDSSYVVGQGMIDSFDINQNFQGYNTGQFVLCHNAVFTFKGNQSSSGPSFYLFPGAKLILKDTYFYPTIYMSDMSTLSADSGIQNIICYRESSAMLLDTSNVNWITDSIVSSMNFTFVNWPNSSSPCTISPPQSTGTIAHLQANVFTSQGRLHYSMKTDKPANINLTDMWGRVLLSQRIRLVGELDLSTIAAGLYIVSIDQNGMLFKKKIMIN